MLRPFFDWFQTLAFSVEFRNSRWMLAGIDALHLLAVAVFFGAILLVDLRLLGLGVKERPVEEVTREAQPWLLGSLVALLVTGVPMIMGNGERYYYNEVFWQKMTLVVIAAAFTFTLRRGAVRLAESPWRPWLRGATGAVSIGLWITVAVYARLIGFQ